MPDQKSTETNNTGHHSWSDKRSSGSHYEKGVYLGEPLPAVQQIPLTTQVNVPLSTNQPSSDKK
jgi:hypothetical protein